MDSDRPTRADAWWTSLAWRLYAPAPVALDGVLRTLDRAVRPLADLRMRVVVQRGPTHANGEVGTLVVAGHGALDELVSSRFFAQAPRTEPVGVVPLWRLPATLARVGAGADLTVARLDGRSARAFLPPDHLLAPEGVSQVLRVPDAGAILPTLARPVQRWLRRTLPELAPELSYAAADFDAFYRTMYVPFARHRFGSAAIVLNVHKLRRAFRQGGVVWATRGGRRVAGCLFLVRGDVLRALVLGTAGGDLGVEETGVLYALYFFALEYAARRGLISMELGHGAPFLSNGVLRHKSWWGARLVVDDAARSDLAVGWTEPNARVRDFLARHPLIFRHGAALAAVTALDGARLVPPARLAQLRRSVALPGLRRLVVIAPEGRDAEYAGRPPEGEGCEIVVCRAADVWAAVRRPLLEAHGQVE